MIRTSRAQILALAFISASAVIAAAAPVITATKDDGVPAATQKVPGTTMTYTDIIKNTGNAPATGVVVTDPDVTNITTNATTINVTGFAVDDRYPLTVPVNVGINTATSTGFSVLANDYKGVTAGVAVASISISAYDATSANGGAVTMSVSGADAGKFTYSPAAGFSGDDTFTYSVSTAAGGTLANLTGTVTITVGGPVIWFVNSAAGAGGTGTLASPFNSIASFNASIKPAINHSIFFYANANPYDGALVLKNGQKLIGQNAGATLASIAGVTALADSPALPAMVISSSAATTTVLRNTAANGNAVTLNNVAGANTIRGLTIGNTGGYAISGSGFGTLTASETNIDGSTRTGGALSLSTGTVAANFPIVSASGTAGGITLSSLTGSLVIGGGTLSGINGDDFKVDGGSATISSAAAISNANGRSVNIQNTTGGSVSLSGAITDTATGILLNANTGATINLSGTLTLTTSSNVAFTATGGGTVNVTGSNNAVIATNATAVNIANTTIGVSGVTFKSVSASGGTNGVTLSSTGSTGGFSITGAASTAVGGDSSGGIIQNTTGAGVSLINTANPSFTNLTIQSTGDSGISGSGVTNFSFSYGTISGSGNAAGESNIAFNAGGANTGNNISGIVYITNNKLLTAFTSGVDIGQNAGTISNATISGNIITSTTSTATSTGYGISLFGTDNGGTVSSLTKALIDSNTIRNFPSGGGIQLIYGNPGGGAAATCGIPTDIANRVQITNNVARGENSTNRFNTSAISVSVSGFASGARSRGNFNISGNGSAGNPIGDCSGTAILLGCNGYATVEAQVNANTIVANNVFASNGIGGGNGISGSGSTQTPDLTLTASSNTISATEGNGILLVGRGATGTARFKIQNNTVAAPATLSLRPGIRVDAGNTQSADDAVLLNISGNTSGGSGGSPGIGLRKQGTVPTVNDFSIQNLIPNPATAAQMEDYVASLNPNSAIGTSSDGTTQKRVISFSGANYLGTTLLPLMLAVSSAQAIAAPAEITNIPAIERTISAAPAAIEVPATANAPAIAPDEITALSQAQLDASVEAAIERWIATGITPQQLEILRAVRFQSADIGGMRLGEAGAGLIRVDRMAGGAGWFFEAGDSAIPAGRVDLLTTLVHEMGHALGLPDSYLAKDRQSVMYGYLGKGERRLPTAGQAENAIPHHLEGEHFLTAPITIGTLPAGKSVTITYDVNISATPVGTTISSQATVSSNELPDVLSNNIEGSTVGSGPTITLLQGLPEIAVYTGSGTVPANEISDAGSAVGLGSTAIGASVAKTFTIQNKGAGALTGVVVSNDGTGNPADFIITQPASTTIAAGSSATFTVTFSPGATGLRGTRIQIASNDADENPFDIDVTGTGLFTPPSVDLAWKDGSLTVDDTSVASSSGSTVVIGESATYDVLVTLPETTTPNLSINTNLSSGFRIDSYFVLTAGGSSGLLTSSFNGTLNTPTLTGGSFSFGNVSAAHDNITTNNSFVIRITGTVLNVATNQQGVLLVSGASAGYTDPTTTNAASAVESNTANNPQLTIAEPLLAVSNQFINSTGGVSSDAGDVLSYTLTISNPSNQSAFGINWAVAVDPLLTNLKITSTSATPGITGTIPSVGSVSGNSIAASVADLRIPAGGSFTLSYNGKLSNTLAPQTDVTNVLTTRWSSLDSNSSDARTGADVTTPPVTLNQAVASAALNDYALSATVVKTTDAAIVSHTLASTSESSTTGSNVAIGELVNYSITVTLPEGTTPNALITETLPPGLQYVSSTISSASFNGSLPGPLVSGGAANGDDVNVNFGTILTVDDNVPGNNSFVISITARVVDVPGITGGSQLAASVAFAVPGQTTITTSPINVTVVEPVFVVTNNIVETSADPGDRVNVTITVQNTGISSSFETVVKLPLAAADFDSSSILFGTVGTQYPAGYTPAFTAGEVRYTGGTLAPGTTQTFSFSVKIAGTVTAGATLTSGAVTAVATSLPGIVATERTSTFTSGTDAISITNHPPTDITLTPAAIAENNLLGAVVGALGAADVDAGDTKTFTLVAGTGSDNNLLFGVTGGNLVINTGADFETKNSYTVRVRVTDSAANTFEKALAVSITNVNEVPSFTKGADQTVPFGATAAQTVNGWATSINDGDSTVVQTLTFNVSTTGDAIFATAPAISGTGVLTYTPNGTAGTATVSVSLTDDASIAGSAALTSTSQTFTITAESAADYTVTTTANTLTVTDVSGNGDDLVLSQPSAGFIRFAATGRRFSVNGGLSISGNSGNVSLAGITNITVNPANGTDIINIGAFTDLPTLVINGAGDTVNFNGDIAFGSSLGLLVNAQVVNVAAGTDILTTGAGTILLTADEIQIDATATLSSNQVGLKPATAGRGISLGAASAGTLSLSDASLDRISTAALTIGDVTSGAIHIGGPVSPSGTGVLTLSSGSSVSGQAALAASKLAIRAASVGTSVQPLPTAVANLEIAATGSSFVNNTGPLVIGGASSSFSGISATAAQISATGSLDVAERFETSGDLTLSTTGVASDIVIHAGIGNVIAGGVLSIQSARDLLSGTAANIGDVSGASVSLTAIRDIIIDNDSFVQSSGAGGLAANAGRDFKVLSLISQGSVFNSNGFSAPSSITTATGAVTLNAGPNATVSTNDGALTITTDSLILSAPGTAAQITSATVTIKPATANLPINIGSTAAGSLSLTDGTLDRITAANLNIGGSSAGTVILSANITRPVLSNVTVTSGSDILLSGGSIDTANGTLALSSGPSPAGVKPTLASTDATASALTLAGQLSLNIAGTTADTQYDQLKIIGGINLNGAALNLTGAYVPVIGNQFILVNNDGVDPVAGTFNGIAEGGTISLNGILMRISYIGGDGNDVSMVVANYAPTNISLTNASIPENNAAGAVVGLLSSTDLDAADSHTYSLVTGAGSDDNDAFTITGNSLKLSVSADFETKFAYAVRIRSDDGNGGLFDKAFIISITNVNEAPTISAITAQVTDEDTATAAISFTIADQDAGSTLTLTAESTNTAVVPIANIAFGGSGGNRSVIITPAANAFGSSTITIKVSDGTLIGSSSFDLTVNSVNDAPLAIAQSVSTNEDTAKSITLTGSDVENSALTFAIVTGPAHGTLAGTPPNVTYTPALDYNGPDSFTFKSNDGSLDSLPATVSITVNPVNDLPVAIAQSVVTDEDLAKAITLTGSDIENSALGYTVVAAPTHGTLGGTAPNLTYTPTLNYNGPDSFTFKVNDGSADSATTATVSITVNPVNDRPLAAAQSVSTNEDTALPITLTGSDVDDDPLTYTITTFPVNGLLTGVPPNVSYQPGSNYNGPDSFQFRVNDGLLDSTIVTVSITVNPVNDAPTVVAPGIADVTQVKPGVTTTLNLESYFSDIESASSALTYSVSGSPATPFFTLNRVGNNLQITGTAPGIVDLTVTATDSDNASVSDSFRLTVKHVPQVAGSGIPDTLLSPASAGLNLDLSGYFFDGDSDALSYGISSNSAPAKVSASVSGSTLTLHPLSPGTATLVIRSTDSDGNFVEDSFDVTVEEPVPTLTPTVGNPPHLNRQTGLWEVSVTATNANVFDVPGFRLRVTSALPAGITLHNSTGPAGSFAPYLDVLTRTSPGQSITVVLEFYSANRNFDGFNPVIIAEPLPPGISDVGTGEGIAVTLFQSLPDGSKLLEFTSIAGRFYQIEYSGDMLTWKKCLVPIQAGANRVQWIDRGSPYTDAPPNTVPSRFYRVSAIAP